jgi:hypothetical protein
MLRLPQFLENRLTDGGEVVSLTRRPLFAPQEDSWYSFRFICKPGFIVGIVPAKNYRENSDININATTLFIS